MSDAERARRYLEASMHAGWTGLSGEHREIQEGTMRRLERDYAQVREHALCGAPADFDRPLDAGARAHQRHLRELEGLTEAEVRRMRRELRGDALGAPSLSEQRRRRHRGELRSAVLGYIVGRHRRASGVAILLGAMLLLLAIGLVLAVVERYWLLFAALLVLWLVQRPAVRDALGRGGERVADAWQTRRSPR